MRAYWLCLLALAAQTATPRFEPMQRELLALGASFVNAWADPDADGDPDLFVGFNGTANRLYRNDAGVLTDVAVAAGVADARATRAAAWGDYDADGDPDLLVGFAPGAGSVLRLYRNDRSAAATAQSALSFADVTDAAGLSVPAGAVRQPAWIDVDADGDLDLFVAFRDRANVLFRNDAGRFTDIAASTGLADARRSVGAVWFDADEDGDLDLYLANMDGDQNALYRNDAGKFTDVATAAGLAWGGRAPGEAANGTVRPCAADVDGDGRFDLFTANYGPNGLFLNKGGGMFEDVSRAWGIAIDARYDTCLFGDMDNDGKVDLYVNGTVTGGTSYRDHLFRNAGGRFEDVTPENVVAIQADHGAAWADVDADGDLDLALTGSRPDGMHWVMRNMLAAPATGRSILVRVLDQRGRATRAGAEVRVFAAGTRRLVGSGLVDSGSGYDAQNDLPVHVGLAGVTRVDVEVTFPAAGKRIVARMANVDPSRATGRTVTVPVGGS
ncbi:MAG TPA: CRTAC1 family protein [Vicinamibacterales bacterium]|nr:CRTAC1 family protein [Vicinamibacterales bacterium]